MGIESGHPAYDPKLENPNPETPEELEEAKIAAGVVNGQEARGVEAINRIRAYAKEFNDPELVKDLDRKLNSGEYYAPDIFKDYSRSIEKLSTSFKETKELIGSAGFDSKRLHEHIGLLESALATNETAIKFAYQGFKKADNTDMALQAADKILECQKLRDSLMGFKNDLAQIRKMGARKYSEYLAASE
ncbi:MAG: hypothetical protein WCT08_04585 [Patescibacteria group bacterium]|jgi:hypothetical protein